MRLLACTLAIALTVVSCSGRSGQPAPPDPSSDPLRVFVVGDSTTEANSPQFAVGRIGNESWAWTLRENAGAVIRGWAVAGATSEDMAYGVSPHDADVVVIMAGTNDIRTGMPFERTSVHLDGIVQTLSVPRVIACSIVPWSVNPAASTDFNARLAALSAPYDWEFVDCAAPVRARAGGWLPGMSDDGIHPNGVGARRIGQAVAVALRASAG
jgi:lysophospholipase L1-like esterase